MAFGLGQAVFQAVLKERAVGQAGQDIVKGGMAGRLLILGHRSQLLFQFLARMDLGLQCQVDGGEFGRSILNFAFNHLTLFQGCAYPWRLVTR